MNFNKILSSTAVFGALILGMGQSLAMQGKELSALFQEESIKKGYVVQKFTERSHTYTLQTYPVSAERTPGRYAPLRGNETGTDAEIMGCLILSQWHGTTKSKLGPILEEWKQQGFSTHWIIGHEGNPIVVRWVDSNVSKGQMAGPWNSRAVEALLKTDDQQNASEAQIQALKEIVAFSNDTYKTKIEYCGDHFEARNSGDKGHIHNIAHIRSQLGLDPLPQQ